MSQVTRQHNAFPDIPIKLGPRGLIDKIGIQIPLQRIGNVSHVGGRADRKIDILADIAAKAYAQVPGR
jgi:hypothetical protein